MRSKTQSTINFKLILICLAFLFLLFLVLRSSSSSSNSLLYSQQTPSLLSSSNSSSSNSQQDQTQSDSTSCPEQEPNTKSTPTCNKISPSLAQAMVHYATSNITPQQTKKEISVSLKVLEKKSPCNFLVFGLGHDSLMWTSLNHGGRTVFLEEDKSWIDQITKQLPTLESYHVVYDTKVTEADQLMEYGLGSEDCKVVSDPRLSKCQLALKGLPSEVYDVEWDLIMVDAPTGYHDGAPGRMTAIYTAGLMARNREDAQPEEEGSSDTSVSTTTTTTTTHVFVHDVDRVVEDKFSKAFLCQGYLTEQEGRIRHFTIPTHRTRLGTSPPFCP